MNQRQRTLEQIAKTVLGITTIKRRYSDELDFHELGVWQIEAALRQAYEAGFEAGKSSVSTDLIDILQEQFSPHAVALLLCKLHPEYAKGEEGQQAEIELRWLRDQLNELLGEATTMLYDEIGV